MVYVMALNKIQQQMSVRSVNQHAYVLDRVERLTPRELEVLRCVAFGMSNEVAGGVLGISRRTVEIHRGHMIRKLGARSSAEAVRIAMMMGIEFQPTDAYFSDEKRRIPLTVG